MKLYPVLLLFCIGFANCTKTKGLQLFQHTGTQGVHELLFCELKVSGSSSIVNWLIQQVWLQYTAMKCNIKI